MADYASLVIELDPESPRRRLPFEVFMGPFNLRQAGTLEVGRPFRLDGLPPGTYEIRRLTCDGRVEVRPRSTTHVTVGPGRCDVMYEPR